MRVRWLRVALANLDAEAEYIAEDNPAAARRVVQKILRAVDPLKKNPAMGRAGRVPGTRELVGLIEGLGLQTSLGSLRVRRKVAAHSAGPIPPINRGHSECSACMTSMRAARAAGSQDATTAAASSTNAERVTGKAPGIFTSKK